MRFGRRHFRWYDLVLLGLAAGVVYPDHILEWISGWTGKTFNWLHLLLLEAVLVAVMVGVTAWLQSAYPTVRWWLPWMMVAVLAAVRFLTWVVTRMFGFDD
jgi:hypothetical protein